MRHDQAGHVPARAVKEASLDVQPSTSRAWVRWQGQVQGAVSWKVHESRKVGVGMAGEQ